MSPHPEARSKRGEKICPVCDELYSVKSKSKRDKLILGETKSKGGKNSNDVLNIISEKDKVCIEFNKEGGCSIYHH